MIQKIYKNTDLLFTISIGDNDNIINIADIGELSITFYTDTTNVENHIVVTKDDIINDNQIFLDNTKLDLLNEGLLKYNIKLRFNNTSINEPFDIAKDVETEYFIKNNNFNDGSCTGGTVSDTYSKSEIDLKLSLKANSSDVYSKAETNERLADKANKSDLPDISILATKDELKLKANTNDVYSKVEVDEKIADAGTVDLSSYYKKNEIDNKLSTKVDVVAGKSLSSNDYTDADKTKLQSLSNYDDTSIKQSLSTKADINNVYTKNEVDKKIDDAVTGEIDLSDYYKKVEIDSKLSEKADISAIAELATKTELAGKADAADVYSKTEVYTKAEVDKKIADAGTGTGGTVTSSEVYILRWDEIQATEERAALYTKLYESFWYNNTVSVLFNVINGTDEYIIDVNNIYKDNSATRNEIKMYGSCILSSSIFHVEIVLKKDGSFTFTKNNIAINKLNTMQLEERIETLESEIKNPTEMKVDCLNYE
ncbi:hypothetical protein [Bacteroides zhangwenhongii]|jgi:hypothetical protein|uniref:hypothetical protein n=1 Tax=Bacteroides zhangwenhongii TaxID=2650157 RepID=UPI0020596401|nr:hypothetical protein [Bacteroides zhangwenhongii]DAT68406.1 MAG TPA: putative AdoMet-dependent methyltransferase [Caudoviricetes sp.]